MANHNSRYRDSVFRSYFNDSTLSATNVSCVRVSDGEEMTFNKDDMISVAQFGEAIYPYLQSLDTVCNAPDSSL